MDAKTLCLGVLTLGEATGYEIKKAVEEGPFAHFHPASFGSIYPALNQLRKDGLVTLSEDGGDQGRADKKVYRISEAGSEAFRRALHQTPTLDRVRSDAVFMMFFAHLLDPHHLATVFDGYLDVYRRNLERLQGLDNEGIPEGRLFVRGLGAAFYDAVVRYMEENRDMVLGDGKSAPDASPSDPREAAE